MPPPFSKFLGYINHLSSLTVALKNIKMSSDPTFKSYTSAQASAYAQQRHGSRSSSSTSYPPELYSFVLDHHSRTGGRLGTLIDVGCGPGNVARDLAPRFERTIGVDPGEEMVKEARRLTALAEEGEEGEGKGAAGWKKASVSFVVGDAGKLADVCRAVGVEDGSVDLIVAGMAVCAHVYPICFPFHGYAKSPFRGNNPLSFHLHRCPCFLTRGLLMFAEFWKQAHWFPLPSFYASVSDLLRPSSGTLAFWTCASLYVHPTRTPSAAKVQQLLSHCEDSILGPHRVLGNRISRTLYADLPMPWNVDPVVPGLPKENFIRQTWNEDGKIPEGQDGFFFGRKETLGRIMGSLGTASMVTRWREANARKPEGEREEDCLEVLGRRLKETLGGGDDVELDAGVGVVVVMGKRAAEGQ